MVDWRAGRSETAAAELEPVAQLAVDRDRHGILPAQPSHPSRRSWAARHAAARLAEVVERETGITTNVLESALTCVAVGSGSRPS